ncbi:MAG: hypothetical protein Q4Q58_01060 [Thermoplasmata archaeon]|nr:hypothetical protein [Thermoplasmata archaeon]
MASNDWQPVRAEGRKLADTWWGKAWDDNLERYSDYSNRIGRGRTYLRNGAVLDLRISGGTAKAKVQGSRSRPYDVSVTIDPLDDAREDEILSRCSSRISTVEALAAGDIPEDVREVFTAQGGLFPSPREIHFRCSCPDWAHMCKHVAAVLYGIGKRFDDDPLLFFELRGMDFEPMIGKSVDRKLESMLANAEKPSDRIIPGDELVGLFGVVGSGDTSAPVKKRGKR